MASGSSSLQVCFEKAGEPEMVKKAEACLLASQAYAAPDDAASKALFRKAAGMFKSALPVPEHLVIRSPFLCRT